MARSGSKHHKKHSKKTPQYEDFKDVVLDARKFLKGNKDADLESDLEFEDEDLDSDEAWGEDEYDVLDNTFSQTTRDKASKAGKSKSILKSREVNEYGEGEDEEWSSSEEGELITLSEAWDRDDRELEQIKKEEAKKAKKAKDNELVLNDDDEEDEEEEEESSSSEEEDEESDDPFDEMNISDEEENTLGTVMSSLSKHLPKEQKERKVMINDKTSESQFALPTEGDELGFDDMLLDDADDETAVELLKSNEGAGDQDSEQRDYHGKVITSNTGAYAVPLPARIQKRQERKAAYEIQREDVNKWKDVIEENREKKTLDFRPAVVEQNPLAAFTPDETPRNELDAKLDAVLKQSNLEEKRSEDLFNNIQTAKMSKEEMLKKTKELRMMRELMYRNERDAKRLKKIKSKSFRKQLRKDKDKEALMMEGLDDEEDQEDPDYLRAKERMTLKHKNTSNWARSLIKTGISKDKESREEMEEMMRRDALLRQKQLGNRGEDESEDDARDLSDLERDIQDEEDVDEEKLSKLGKGVLAMDFMKNAAAKERLAHLQQVQQMKSMRESTGEELFQDNEDNGINVAINSGRRIYTPSAMVKSREANEIDEEILRENEEDDSRSLENRLKTKERVSVRVQEEEEDSEVEDNENQGDNSEDDEANPWLDEDSDDEANASKKSSKVSALDKNSKAGDKFQSRINKDLAKQEGKSKKKNSKKVTEEEVKIDTSSTLNIVDPKKEAMLKKKRAAAASDDEMEDDGGNGEDEVYMFKQEDLIKQAFAGDDLVEAEFDEEKEQIIEREDDKEIDDSMPGWGDWAGQGEDDDGWGQPRPKKKRKIIRKVQGVTSKNQRLDKGKEKVIINETVAKASVKYQADKIPYPFKTWEEYEKSLRMPLGKEWVSDSTFQKMTTPEVITRFGTVINPMKAPFK